MQAYHDTSSKMNALHKPQTIRGAQDPLAQSQVSLTHCTQGGKSLVSREHGGMIDVRSTPRNAISPTQGVCSGSEPTTQCELI